MSPIRPQFPTVQTRTTAPAQSPARNVAQRAFFEAAVQKAGGAYSEPKVEKLQPIPTATARPDEAPKRYLRPGSFIDIKV